MELNEKMLVAEMEKFLHKHEVSRVKNDVVGRIVTLVIAALGLIAALAWDKALHHVFEELFGGKETVMGDLGYAVIVTVIAAIVSIQLGKMFGKSTEK